MDIPASKTPRNTRHCLREEVFAGIAAKQVKGYKGIRLLKRELKSEVEFVTIMTFDNLRSVVEFAGEDYEKAYVPPRPNPFCPASTRTRHIMK